VHAISKLKLDMSVPKAYQEATPAMTRCSVHRPHTDDVDSFHPRNHALLPLLPNSTLVEGKLLTLEDVSVDTTALARSAGDESIETTGLKLPLEGRVDLAAESPLGLLGDDTLALLLLLLLGTGLLLSATADVGAVVCLVPLSERSGIDLDDGGAGQGVGSDEFVVGGVEGDGNDTGLAADAL